MGSRQATSLLVWLLKEIHDPFHVFVKDGLVAHPYQQLAFLNAIWLSG